MAYTPYNKQASRPKGATPPKPPALYAGPEGPELKFDRTTYAGQKAYEAEMSRIKQMGRDTLTTESLDGVTTLKAKSTWRRPEAKGLNLQPPE
jgi:hypothetical protein